MGPKYGRKPTAVENMSDAIAFGGIIYLAAAALVVVAIVLFNKRFSTPLRLFHWPPLNPSLQDN